MLSAKGQVVRFWAFQIISSLWKLPNCIVGRNMETDEHGCVSVKLYLQNTWWPRFGPWAIVY
jgi:hypothetical protein